MFGIGQCKINVRSFVKDFPCSRNMATLRDIQTRLKSIKNISKITKSMKMISSTKLARAQKVLDVSRVYGLASTSFLKNIEYKDPEKSEKELLITCSSDRGLCGAIHSSISKLTKKMVREKPGTSVIVLGDKAKTQVSREARKNIVLSFNQIGKAAPTMSEALTISQKIIENSKGYDKLIVLYNRFKSVIAYEQTAVSISTTEGLAKAPKINSYEIDEEDLLRDYTQFHLANTIYTSLMESHTAENAARRTAMDNAAKNAGEIITRLTMKYNRTRQAVITNELVDIIVGASAL